MQKLINKRSIVIDYLMMIVGTGLLAAAIQCLYDPIGLVTGGFTGLAIVIKAVTERFVPGGIPLWLTNIGLNVPLFFLTLKFKGKRFIWRTVVGTVLLSAWIYVIPAIDLTQQDYFLAALFGGVIGGPGMGLILLARSTTGGTELLAVLIQQVLLTENICSSPSTHKFDILLSFGWIIFCIFSYFLLYFGIFIQNFNHYSIFVIFHVRLQNYISIPIFNTFCYCTYRFTAIFPITINTAIRTILTYPA